MIDLDERRKVCGERYEVSTSCRRGVKNLLLLLLAFVAMAQAAQSSYDLIERANALYRDGKFKQAIILYRKAEARGADPSAVSFNIANSSYQQECTQRRRRAIAKLLIIPKAILHLRYSTWQAYSLGFTSIQNALRLITVP